MDSPKTCGIDDCYDPFYDRNKFQDDIWGQILLNDLERDVVDTPEFQRLFRISQLGFVDLVYQTANHTRGAHSIGACYAAKLLLGRLSENTDKLRNEYAGRSGGELYPDFEISPAEIILIRLGALLHDVSHVPLSHDLEKKSHQIPYESRVKVRSWYGHYNKHDDYETNPLFYRFICDVRESVLARVLCSYSRAFWDRLQKDASNRSKYPHIFRFVEEVRRVIRDGWEPSKCILSQLLFHLLVFEKEEDAQKPALLEFAMGFGETPRSWHIGPESLPREEILRVHNCWYQPFRHDVIGNTLSADLIDYLRRDLQRMGSRRNVDLHLLNYYILVARRTGDEHRKFYRCALDLQDHKRGTTRSLLINDIFRLLDLRQEIHEKAVMHRVVQSANAMLARGLLLLGSERRPSLEKVAGVHLTQHRSLQSEDLLFQQLFNACQATEEMPRPVRSRLSQAYRIFEKLVERRVYRPLMIVPGDRAADKLPLPHRDGSDPRNSEFPLRSLAAIVDSAYYSPFLLFVSSCIEKYLEGIFDTDSELCTFVQTSDIDRIHADLTTGLPEWVASRVIIWTSPYKQLYKDPAIVVALDGCVDQIDELVKPGKIQGIHDDSTSLRLQTAILDADSKYTCLWRLYVFISDGLYYTGILNKLLRHLPHAHTTSLDRDLHKDRLNKAQSLLGTAFESMSANWSALSERNVDRGALLDNPMKAAAFKGLLSRWIGEYRDESGRVGKLSTVDTAHYYHEFALDSGIADHLKRPCRDTRYKFDRDAVDVWAKGETNVGSDEHALIHFLKRCGIDTPKALSNREFDLLVARFRDPDTRLACEQWIARSQHQPSTVVTALKTLFLAGFPLSYFKEREQVTARIPQTRDEIKGWIEEEVALLQPNVCRRIRAEIDTIVQCLEACLRSHGSAVIDDVRLRVRNEQSLTWNDVRVGRIVAALNRKWEDPVTQLGADLENVDEDWDA